MPFEVEAVIHSLGGKLDKVTIVCTDLTPTKFR